MNHNNNAIIHNSDTFRNNLIDERQIDCYDVQMKTTNVKSSKLVTYTRVSTKRQGDSGLGLEGQTTALLQYAASECGTIVATYTEVESGKNNDRPQLARAIQHAKRLKCRLVIAKLDRLARNVAFVSTLMEAGVDFVAVDNPNANRLTIHILAAVAEDEARRISERTIAALAAAKARGVLLGTHRPGHYTGTVETHRANAVKARKAGAIAYAASAGPLYDEITPICAKLRADGRSLADIATHLNGEGFTTLRGKEWGPMQVMRLLAAA